MSEHEHHWHPMTTRHQRVLVGDYHIDDYTEVLFACDCGEMEWRRAPA